MANKLNYDGKSLLNIKFSPDQKGYDPLEVDQVLDKIIKDYESIPCDILKVGHHGSNTSTSDEFVKYLAPREAVISCGVNNRYGHPKKSVLETLERNGVKIRRTDLEGTITYRHYIFM